MTYIIYLCIYIQIHTIYTDLRNYDCITIGYTKYDNIYVNRIILYIQNN